MTDTEKKPNTWWIDIKPHWQSNVYETEAAGRIRVVEACDYDALAKQLDELKAELAIMKSRASQYESTVLATVAERDEFKEKLKISEEALESIRFVATKGTAILWPEKTIAVIVDAAKQALARMRGEEK